MVPDKGPFQRTIFLAATARHPVTALAGAAAGCGPEDELLI
jgi:hypothetical protein